MPLVQQQQLLVTKEFRGIPNVIDATVYISNSQCPGLSAELRALVRSKQMTKIDLKT